jgi:hypothetical protein
MGGPCCSDRLPRISLVELQPRWRIAADLTPSIPFLQFALTNYALVFLIGMLNAVLELTVPLGEQSRYVIRSLGSNGRRGPISNGLANLEFVKHFASCRPAAGGNGTCKKRTLLRLGVADFH